MHPALSEQINRISQRDDLSDDISTIKSSTDETHSKYIKDINPLSLFSDEKYYNDVWCYNKENTKKIKLVKLITNSDNVCLVKGLMLPGNSPVVVKMYQGSKKDTSYEVSIYKKIRKTLNIPRVWFSSSFYFWGVNVLVMERLYPINGEDDEYEITRQIIPQMKELHKLGCHNDIKIQNIMKRGIINNDNTISIEYLIIDFGGFTTEKLKDGFKRLVWTPRTAAQKKESNQVTYPYYDLIEFCHAMRQVQLSRIGKKDNVKEGFLGKLKDIYDICKSAEHYPSNEDYNKILKVVKDHNN
jgi:hypothetical protein